MLNTLSQAIYVNPVLAVLPGLMIFITSICFTMLNGLRAAMA
jgi:peptide/nickel transport system permease protein